MTPEAAHMTDTSGGEVAPTIDSSGGAAPAPATRRWVTIIPWVVAVVALAIAGVSTWQWRQLASQQEAIDSARTAAVAFARDLTNWDASDGLADEIERLRNQGTGPFLDEIDLVFGGDELTGQLESDGVSASGEVEEVFVQDFRDGVAEVFTVVSVVYRATDVERDLDPVTFPASLVLVRSGDGGWLVREVTIPNSSQIGQLMAPSSGG